SLKMKTSIAAVLVSAGCITTLSCLSVDLVGADAFVHSQPLHGGSISPMLFGNFIELLDDVVPGMWAELLNDRSFEGVLLPANWSYYDGSPDICDRQWDTNGTWAIEKTNAFNGGRCARLDAREHTASLTQSGLAVTKGMRY